MPLPPFHAGEIAVQTRLGAAAGAEKAGRRSIRDHMIQQHQEFFPLLPMLFVGARDAEGVPWASVLAGDLGFVHALDERRLRIEGALSSGDALAGGLSVGQDIGLLGLQWETRRRNRLNGRIAAMSAGGIDVAVTQSFGNCPKYIQTRERVGRSGGGIGVVESRTDLSDADRALIARSDMLMIATAHPDGGDASEGVDVSHRGGKPGFVAFETDGALRWADYPGNRFYNTLGNIEVDPRVGLLFLDWATGAGLQVSGKAEIVWGDDRAVRVRVDRVQFVPGMLPDAWRLMETSPHLDRL
ncbi:MAG: pyridoxamine 5'-phosphate oxidase family protein [Alphaproteobacteria bacterium]